MCRSLLYIVISHGTKVSILINASNSGKCHLTGLGFVLVLVIVYNVYDLSSILFINQTC